MILLETTIQLARKGGVAFLVKHGLVINKEVAKLRGHKGLFKTEFKKKNGMNVEYRNSDFNIITENEALAINLELSNNQNLTLATIYCPNGNPNFSLFQSINNPPTDVVFVGDFNSKLESFGCAHRNPLWSCAQKYTKTT